MKLSGEEDFRKQRMWESIFCNFPGMEIVKYLFQIDGMMPPDNVWMRYLMILRSLEHHLGEYGVDSQIYDMLKALTSGGEPEVNLASNMSMSFVRSPPSKSLLLSVLIEVAVGCMRNDDWAKFDYIVKQYWSSQGTVVTALGEEVPAREDILAVHENFSRRHEIAKKYPEDKVWQMIDEYLRAAWEAVTKFFNARCENQPLYVCNSPRKTFLRNKKWKEAIAVNENKAVDESRRMTSVIVPCNNGSKNKDEEESMTVNGQKWDDADLPADITLAEIQALSSTLQSSKRNPDCAPELEARGQATQKAGKTGKTFSKEGEGAVGKLSEKASTSSKRKHPDSEKQVQDEGFVETAGLDQTEGMQGLEDVHTQPEDDEEESESVVEILAVEFLKVAGKATGRRLSLVSAADPESGNNISLVRELKKKSAKLKDLGRDPLPEAILVAQTVAMEQSGSKKSRSDLEETVAAKPSEMAERSPAPLDSDKQAQGAVEAPSGEPQNVQNLRLRGNLMEAQANARKISWDSQNEIDEETQEGDNGRLAARPQLRPVSAERTFSPLTSEDAAIPNTVSKRRRNTPWSRDETDALIKGHGKYGSKWRLTLLEYRNIFNGRTTVDLKDKWRNIEKFGNRA